MLKSLKSILILLPLLVGNFLNAQSPYELKLEREAVIFGIGSGTALTGFLLEGNISPSKPEDITRLVKTDVNRFDRSACDNYNTKIDKVSDVAVVALAAVPSLMLLSGDVRSDFTTVAGMYIETLAFMYALPTIVKGSVTRYRPYVYNENVPLEEKLNAESKKSYFSGHTTTAFASAVFLSTVYSDYFPDSKYTPWVWGGSLLAAATVGYLRYASGNHYPTDIITGAIIGSAVGYLVPYLHRVSNKSQVSALPEIGFHEFKIGVSFQF